MSLTHFFSEALKRYRELVGMNQERLAAESSLDRTYISQLERGLKSPTLNTLEKLAACLGVQAQDLLRDPVESSGPRFPGSYLVRDEDHLILSRGEDQVQFRAAVLTSAINVAHGLIDDLYTIDLDIAAILGLRNLSAFIGELVATAVVKTGNGRFLANPHQDGYPDLLLMDDVGLRELNRLQGRMNEKGPFSPFAGGGIEVKATCGSIPTPAVCRRRGIERPDNGDTRIHCMTAYDWKAHHRETNNLVGVLWDFIDRRPRIVAMFYCNKLEEHDWGRIVQPRRGGGRTTSVSIMNRNGISKMYAGWLCVLSGGGYREFLNRRNKDRLIP